MLTVHNVVAAAATVGLVGREGDLMRKVAIPCGYYLLAAGTFTYLAVWGLGANAGTVALGVLLAMGSALLVLAARERKQSTDDLGSPAAEPAPDREEQA
jgi:lactate permease